jgi:segregation and condensation protein A
LKDYRVDLDVYNGPLDLLLFLIRKEEVDIYDIPIAQITAQYVAYVRLIKQLDPNVAGEFLVLAATLMEIKSRMLLPRPPAEVEEDDFIDPRLELVRQLLEYKTFKDAARRLGLAAEIQALKHPRQLVALPSGPAEIELDELQIWDLLDAFNKLLEQTGRRQMSHEVVYDDTPLALHATDVLDSLARAGGAQRFESIFEGRTRSQLIGLFLALLELIRRRRIRVEQDRAFGTIVIFLLDASPIEEGFDRAFEPSAEEADDAPLEPEAVEDTDDAAADEVSAPPEDALRQPDSAPDAGPSDIDADASDVNGGPFSTERAGSDAGAGAVEPSVEVARSSSSESVDHSEDRP